jgi:TonB family protein
MGVLNILFKRTYWISCALAVGIHALFLCPFPSLVEPPQYSLSKGLSQLEVRFLVAPHSEKKGISPEITKSITSHGVVVSKKTKFPSPLQKQASSSPFDQQSFLSASGAIDVMPGYIHNPQPLYPEGERQKGHEGTVLLRVALNEHGEILHLGVESSSGYPLLDQQALKTVERRWIFYPAHRRSHTAASTVLIPIRFSLVD